ncbi:MAG: hypothetical protein A2653_01865 [Candidatus Zambryskibacteria bacterium RIFCSPHIGHO2_01_FULL_43_25]|uniref:DUF5652 domain-containing protein n=1 Tax=Candidatus Zambryskibacteria bacterium RIFCSPLOWO2_01_FULL_45_21 TaxID=1802761 RepID=A0A1G2U1J2_9BACT|nr:MAG: hypothetical protein A2653_01865 [Candidatus Zambryskibacteria bacterium RIFCSPHIGHO2_01_FULL_43_25]OHB01107.1 MAG: hypothetical protein A3E94_00500 [Candidatus Zambryskibacteria bacterium RIFCSPHIGHO2_12_FULL_44_12b]OHB03367.1 MAG: hypothetical protein A3B14_00465 [Candidatus Zambryskibacteria bacterium RIFCSPLOWO2_01_FULL_45_21]
MNILNSFILKNPLVFTLLIVWLIAWKGVALWNAARLSQKKWFIVLLIVNTLGILEIIYIFAVAKKYKVTTEEIKSEDK